MPTSSSSPAARPAARFVLTATAAHVVTYFLAGFVASGVLDYAGLFELPVLRDYYLTHGSTPLGWSLAGQVARGALFGLALLPFRGVLAAARLGWLWLWLLFWALAIWGPSAAAPGSIEGVLYTKIPLWFHAIGQPEMLLQTLAFSLVVHRSLRAAEHPLRPLFRTLLQAFAVACISFLGYTVVSLAFAFAQGVGVQAGADARVLGQFVAPLLLAFGVALAPSGRWWLPKHAVLYVASAGALAAYQLFVLGSTGWAYVLVAPILPVLIALAMTRPGATAGAPGGRAPAS